MERLYKAHFGIRRIDVDAVSFRLAPPTLTRLIQKCGDQFCELYKWDVAKYPSRWAAIGQLPFNESADASTVTYRIDADTPEAAVAELWLVLFDKPSREAYEATHTCYVRTVIPLTLH